MRCLPLTSGTRDKRQVLVGDDNMLRAQPVAVRARLRHRWRGECQSTNGGVNPILYLLKLSARTSVGLLRIHYELLN